MASFDSAPLARRYAQDERLEGPATARPERSEVCRAKSKDAISPAEFIGSMP